MATDVRRIGEHRSTMLIETHDSVGACPQFGSCSVIPGNFPQLTTSTLTQVGGDNKNSLLSLRDGTSCTGRKVAAGTVLWTIKYELLDWPL